MSTYGLSDHSKLHKLCVWKVRKLSQSCADVVNNVIIETIIIIPIILIRVSITITTIGEHNQYINMWQWSLGQRIISVEIFQPRYVRNKLTCWRTCPSYFVSGLIHLSGSGMQKAFYEDFSVFLFLSRWPENICWYWWCEEYTALGKTEDSCFSIKVAKSSCYR